MDTLSFRLKQDTSSLNYYQTAHIKVHVPNFGGVSGSVDRGGDDNSIQFINVGRVGDKSFKELRRKIGGGRVGDNNILTFLCYWLDKRGHYKKTAFWAIFSVRICKVP